MQGRAQQGDGWIFKFFGMQVKGTWQHYVSNKALDTHTPKNCQTLLDPRCCSIAWFGLGIRYLADFAELCKILARGSIACFALCCKCFVGSLGLKRLALSGTCSVWESKRRAGQGVLRSKRFEWLVPCPEVSKHPSAAAHQPMRLRFGNSRLL